MSGIHIERLAKSFGREQVLKGINLDVPDGAFVTVLGPSGCGKTTLLRIIAGFARADAGIVRTGDVIVDDAGARYIPTERRRIGYLTQEGGLFPHLTVGANVEFGLRRSRDRGARVSELLELVGLSGLESRRPDELSGGEQQRVALARALAPEPRLVLLDEPFSTLDASLRVTLRADVSRVLRDSAATVILVTHDQEEALSLGDQVAVMRDGLIVQLDTPTALYTRPADPETAAFVGDANLLPATVDGSIAHCALGQLPLATPLVLNGRHVLVLVRPEQCVITSGASPLQGNATVIRSDFHGHDATIRLRLDGQADRPVVARVKGIDVVPPGTRVTLTVAGPVHAWPVTSGSV